MRKKNLLNIDPKYPKTRHCNDVLATSQIEVDESGRATVCINLFYYGRLRARWFGCVEENKHITYFVEDEWSGMKIDNAARKIKGQDMTNFVYRDEFKWDSLVDKEVVKMELGCSVDRFEKRIADEKRDRAYESKRMRIKRRLESLPEIPKDLESWLNESVFAEHILFFKRDKKRSTYHCTECGAKSWTTKKWKHNEMITCPKCRKEVQAKSRVSEYKKRHRVTLLQAAENEWVERGLQAECIWDDSGKHISIYEDLLVFIPEGEHRGREVYYGHLYDAEIGEQGYWTSNPVNKQFGMSYLYPNNLDEVLPMGELERSGMDILAKQTIPFKANLMILRKEDCKYMEYLIKCGFTKLAVEIVKNYFAYWGGSCRLVNPYGSNAKELLKLDGNRVNRLKQMNGGVNALIWLQEEQRKNIRINQETLEYLAKSNIEPEDLEPMQKGLGTVTRVVNYLKKQKKTSKNIISLWRDYLEMAEAEGMNVEDDIVRFPKDLKGRHDALVDLINERKDKEKAKKLRAEYKKLNKQIKEHLEEVKIFAWENEKYAFIPAEKCEELDREGSTLHHCVGASGTYRNNMAAGRSWIVFLRKKDNIEKAYYTIEIDMKSDKVIQWRSEFNRRPDSEKITKLLSEYKSYIRKRRTEEKLTQSVNSLEAAG
jgi:DNA-directed RNA polymerase subunit RPC12/RpoP